MLGWRQATQAERPAVGRDRRARDEVGAGGQHHAAVGVVAVQVEPHQLVGRLRLAGVVLAHREHVVAVQHQAAEAPRAGRGDGHRLGGTGIEPVHAVVTGVREHERAVAARRRRRRRTRAPGCARPTGRAAPRWSRVPSCRSSAVRPPSLGRPASQYVSRPSTRTSSRVTCPVASDSGLIGDGQVP